MIITFTPQITQFMNISIAFLRNAVKDNEKLNNSIKEVRDFNNAFKANVETINTSVEDKVEDKEIKSQLTRLGELCRKREEILQKIELSIKDNNNATMSQSVIDFQKVSVEIQFISAGLIEDLRKIVKNHQSGNIKDSFNILSSINLYGIREEKLLNQLPGVIEFLGFVVRYVEFLLCIYRIQPELQKEITGLIVKFKEEINTINNTLNVFFSNGKYSKIQRHSLFIEENLSKWGKGKIKSTLLGQLLYLEGYRINAVRTLNIIEHIFSLSFTSLLEERHNILISKLWHFAYSSREVFISIGKMEKLFRGEVFCSLPVIDDLVETGLNVIENKTEVIDFDVKFINFAYYFILTLNELYSLQEWNIVRSKVAKKYYPFLEEKGRLIKDKIDYFINLFKVSMGRELIFRDEPNFVPPGLGKFSLIIQFITIGDPGLNPELYITDREIATTEMLSSVPLPIPYLDSKDGPKEENTQKQQEPHGISIPGLSSVQPATKLPSIQSIPNFPFIKPVTKLPSIQSTPNFPFIKPVAKVPSIQSTPNFPSMQQSPRVPSAELTKKSPAAQNAFQFPPWKLLQGPQQFSSVSQTGKMPGTQPAKAPVAEIPPQEREKKSEMSGSQSVEIDKKPLETSESTKSDSLSMAHITDGEGTYREKLRILTGKIISTIEEYRKIKEKFYTSIQKEVTDKPPSEKADEKDINVILPKALPIQKRFPDKNNFKKYIDKLKSEIEIYRNLIQNFHSDSYWKPDLSSDMDISELRDSLTGVYKDIVPLIILEELLTKIYNKSEDLLDRVSDFPYDTQMTEIKGKLENLQKVLPEINMYFTDSDKKRLIKGIEDIETHFSCLVEANEIISVKEVEKNLVICFKCKGKNPPGISFCKMCKSVLPFSEVSVTSIESSDSGEILDKAIGDLANQDIKQFKRLMDKLLKGRIDKNNLKNFMDRLSQKTLLVKNNFEKGLKPILTKYRDMDDLKQSAEEFILILDKFQSAIQEGNKFFENEDSSHLKKCLSIMLESDRKMKDAEKSIKIHIETHTKKSN